MKRLYILIFILFLCENTFSQGEFNNWYFGTNAGITFNTSPPSAVTNGALSIFDQTSTISDAAGNLIMYSDGLHVWDRNHNQMPNGFDILGAGVTYSHASIISRKPGSSNLYYIFSLTYFGDPAGFQYAIVDMSLNGGMGDVISKNNMLLTPVSEKLTAVKHPNGTDLWVITHEWNSDAFYAYLLTSTGISVPVITHLGPVHSGGSGYNYNAAGQLTATTDGSRLALATYEMAKIEIYDFDNVTGVISNQIEISGYDRSWGVQFSPDGSKLYVTQWTYSDVYQLDLSAGSPTAIANSATLVGTATSPDTQYKAGFLQLAPDGKIYLAKYGSGYVGVINNPNNLGTACNFVDNGIYLSGKTCQAGLPNFVPILWNFPDFTIQNECLGDTVAIQTQNLVGFSSYNWDFGDPASGSNNFSNILNPTHYYTSVGTYTITLITQQGSISDTIQHAVTIYPLPQVNLGNDTILCSNNSFTLNAGNTGGSYLWSTGATTQTIFVNNSNTYWVSVSNGHCSASDTIQINFQALNVQLGNDTVICGASSQTLNAATIGATYLWSTGETTQTITVQTSGPYWVNASNNACSASDTIQIAFAAPPTVALGNDTTICSSGVVQLNAFNNGATYNWSNGAISSSISVSTQGTYSVEVTIGNCQVSDTINLSVIPPLNLGGTASLCNDPQIKLSVPENTSTYTWSTGSLQPSITITEPGIYWLSAEVNHCLMSDTLYVGGGYGDLFLPNAFTPNNDGVNDTYGPLCEGITEYTFMIFNSWGEEIFESTDTNHWWNGEFKSKHVPTGVYVWVIDYRSACEKNIRKYGTVTVYY